MIPGAPAAPDLRGLRVLGACDYLAVPHRVGGVELVTDEVYRRLAAWGAHLQVVSASPGGTSRTAPYPVHVVPSLDVSRVVGAQLTLARGARRRLRALAAPRPDVLHANGLHFASSVALASLRRPLGVPLVVSAHLGDVRSLPAKVRWPTAAYEHTVGRAVLRGAARVLAVSEAVASHVCTLGADPARVVVVPNGVDHARFAGAAVPRPTDGPLALVYVGRLIANKGPAVLLDAVAALQAEGVPLRVDVLGDGPERAALEAQVHQAGLAAVVRFHGHRDDVPAWVGAAHVLVRPSFTEGMPLAVLEAMASGAVVVASDLAANAALVRHGRTGRLFRTGDASALAAELRWCAEHRAALPVLAATATEVAGAWSWDTTAARTAEVLVAAAER